MQRKKKKEKKKTKRGCFDANTTSFWLTLFNEFKLIKAMFGLEIQLKRKLIYLKKNLVFCSRYK